MHPEAFQVELIMLVLALLTPLLGVAVWRFYRHEMARRGIEMTPSLVRNIWILTFAGPVNLLAWKLLNQDLDRFGGNSLPAYALAAVVFIAAGFLTGFFSRLRQGRSRADRPHEE